MSSSLTESETGSKSVFADYLLETLLLRGYLYEVEDILRITE
ncbi:hypothetical protein [Haladaptatus sp. NG-SE-30]